MVSAVVLVNTQVGEENRVLEDIKRLPIVEDVQVLWGVYDLMVRVKTNTWCPKRNRNGFSWFERRIKRSNTHDTQ
jgi:hypothetical protein